MRGWGAASVIAVFLSIVVDGVRIDTQHAWKRLLFLAVPALLAGVVAAFLAKLDRRGLVIPPTAPTEGRSRVRTRLGVWSVVPLEAFVPWLAGTMVLMPGGEEPFGASIGGTEWLEWAGLSLMGVLPLVVAAVLGWLGVLRGGGQLAWVGAIAGTVLTYWLGVLPAFGWL